MKWNDRFSVLPPEDSTVPPKEYLTCYMDFDRPRYEIQSYKNGKFEMESWLMGHTVLLWMEFPEVDEFVFEDQVEIWKELIKKQIGNLA